MVCSWNKKVKKISKKLSKKKKGGKNFLKVKNINKSGNI